MINVFIILNIFIIYRKKYILFFYNCVKTLTHLAIDMNPQDAVACKGVHPSLSPRLISAPCSTKNSTISKSSSMQAYYT